MIDKSLAFVRDALPLLRELLALVGDAVSLIRSTLPVIKLTPQPLKARSVRRYWFRFSPIFNHG